MNSRSAPSVRRIDRREFDGAAVVQLDVRFGERVWLIERLQ